MLSASFSIAEQSGEQIIFRYDDAKHIPARKLFGLFKPIEALEDILKDTGLKAHRNPEGTIVIRKDPDFETTKASINNPLPKKRPFEEDRSTEAIIETSYPESGNQEPEEFVITGCHHKRGGCT